MANSAFSLVFFFPLKETPEFCVQNNWKVGKDKNVRQIETWLGQMLCNLDENSKMIIVGCLGGLAG